MSGITNLQTPSTDLLLYYESQIEQSSRIVFGLLFAPVVRGSEAQSHLVSHTYQYLFGLPRRLASFRQIDKNCTMEDEKAYHIVSDPFKVCPISKLNADIFLLIFQTLVDDAKSELDGRVNSPKHEPPAAASLLSLVCKMWKELVYNSPSLWSVISLDLKKNSNKIQRKCDLQARLSGIMPVDLYLWHIRSPADGCYDDSKPSQPKCTSCQGKLAISIENITNIRTLCATVTGVDASRLFKTTNLSKLNNLCQLNIFFESDAVVSRRRFDILPLLSHVPQLLDLKLRNVGDLNLKVAYPEVPLLPRLRTLELSSRYRVLSSPINLEGFISHAPNIQDLKIFIFRLEKDIPSFPTVVLPRLQRIFTQYFGPILYIVNGNHFTAPALEEIVVTEWENVLNDACRRFLAMNPKIKRVGLTVKNESGYDQAFLDNPYIEEITISGQGEGQWLSPLYLTTKNDHLTGRPLLMSPNLREITILVNTAPLSRTFFEGLVRVRFIAVDEWGHTTAGCKASDVLKIRFRSPELISPDLMQSFAWRQAEEKQMSQLEYELRWPDRPPAKVAHTEQIKTSNNVLHTSTGPEDDGDSEEEDYSMFL